MSFSSKMILVWDAVNINFQESEFQECWMKLYIHFLVFFECYDIESREKNENSRNIKCWVSSLPKIKAWVCHLICVRVRVYYSLNFWHIWRFAPLAFHKIPINTSDKFITIFKTEILSPIRRLFLINFLCTDTIAAVYYKCIQRYIFIMHYFFFFYSDMLCFAVWIRYWGIFFEFWSVICSRDFDQCPYF